MSAKSLSHTLAPASSFLDKDRITISIVALDDWDSMSDLDLSSESSGEEAEDANNPPDWFPYILDPTAITTTPHDLKFCAAANRQLVIPRQSSSPGSVKTKPPTLPQQFFKASDRLVSSPYNSPLHTLLLQSLPSSSALFALALTTLHPTRPDYATAPYLISFNWADVFTLLRRLCSAYNYRWTATVFYVVTFRSRRKQGWKAAAGDEVLDIGALDAAAHGEATESGGLLKYWFGDADEEGRNLATCACEAHATRSLWTNLMSFIGLWHSQADAKRGGAGPGHARAMHAAAKLYESFKFDRLKLVIENDVAGSRLEPW